MEATIRTNTAPPVAGVENFRREVYPQSIKTVIDDMDKYSRMVDTQLHSPTPYHIRDFINFSESGNKKNIALFRKEFGFNSDNKSFANKEIKGLYALAEEQNGTIQIVNIGISKTIMRRLYQHTCGKKHNESTLGFYMALNEYKERFKEDYAKDRSSFPYEEYRPNIMEYIRSLRFAIVPIDNNFELYMAEVYLACHYKTLWNTFETH